MYVGLTVTLVVKADVVVAVELVYVPEVMFKDVSDVTGVVEALLGAPVVVFMTVDGTYEEGEDGAPLALVETVLDTVELVLLAMLVDGTYGEADELPAVEEKVEMVLGPAEVVLEEPLVEGT